MNFPLAGNEYVVIGFLKMWRMIIGFIMILFVLLVAITYKKAPGDPRTYANMLGGVLAIVGIPGAILFFAGWRSKINKE